MIENLRLTRRPRRNRKSKAIRALTQETYLNAADLVAPFFIVDGDKRRDPILEMPGISRLSIDTLILDLKPLIQGGLQAIALFPKIEPSRKDDQGSYALRADGLIPRAIAKIKEAYPHLCLITDVALDPYTTHGHDGLLAPNGDVANDATVDALAQQALTQAAAGADIIAPSDMMDGRIQAIRHALDQNGFEDVSLLSYAAKYASSLYAPFRGAVGVAQVENDKRGYQMNPANAREARLEGMLDVEEGADMLMVKPATFYLDVISQLKESTLLPIAAYHVSGEYAMVQAARHLVDVDAVFYEALLSIKRAGADIIFSYATPNILKCLNGDRLVR